MECVWFGLRRGVCQGEKVLLQAEGDVPRGEGEKGESGVRPNLGKYGHLPKVLGARGYGNGTVDERLEGAFGSLLGLACLADI